MVERRFIADRGDQGVRLDLMLRRHLAGTESPTRTEVQGWIRRAAVAVNGTIVRRVAARTMMGDVVTVTVPAEAMRQVMTAEAVPLDIIYEDEDLLVLNKPAGIVVHPTYGHMAQTVMNGLLWRARDWPADRRPSIVGRLDKQTSGLVVVAKSRDVHAALQRTLGGSGSEKLYLAVVYGRVPAPPFTIDLRLQRDPADRRRVVASRTEGQASLTHVVRLAETDAAGVHLSLVKCRLMTGRMHQIRVHLAASGWPIVGDAKYDETRWEGAGDAEMAARLSTFPHQALHAWRVSVRHPRTGERLVVDAALPDGLRRLVEDCFPTFNAAADRGGAPELPDPEGRTTARADRPATR